MTTRQPCQCASLWKLPKTFRSPEDGARVCVRFYGRRGRVRPDVVTEDDRDRRDLENLESSWE
mgnify:CR=1 FL=1